MRNLKRALSLALASAMLLGMMVVGASAATEYKDDSSINNVEAVDLLTGLGIVGGDTTGNFNPTATLTRAEFCVMIANMLSGGTFDATLFSGATTPFTDVTGHWGAAYIAYCYSVGVIAGTSATTFGPDSTLTAAQASAILLSALGYNQNGEFGANGQFELNVTSWAQQAGLYEGLSVSAVAGISRDNTAKLMFNALTVATPVTYNSLAGAYSTVGEGVLSGVVVTGIQQNGAYFNDTLGYKNFNLRYTVKTGTAISYGPTSTSTASTYAMTIGNGIYVTVDANEIGRTGYVWYCINGDKYEAVSDVYYTDSVIATVSNGKTITSWTTKGNGNFAAEVDNINGDIYIVNGASADSYTDAGIATLEAQTGVVFTFVDNNGNGKADLVYVADRTVYTIDNAPTTKVSGGKTIVSVPGVTGLAYSNDVEAADVIGYEGLVKDDVVLVYQDGQSGKYYIEKAATVTGTLTSIKGGDFTVGGVTYKASGLTSTPLSAINSNTYLNKSVQLWLDASGYVVKSKAVEAGDLPFALVMDYDSATMAGQLTKLLTTDGQFTTVTANYYANKADANATAMVKTQGETNLVGTVVQYEIVDGTYKLYKATSATASAEGTLAGVNQIHKGTASLVSGASTVVANASTTFILVDSNNNVNSYTGIANVPTTTGTMVAVGKGSTASVVFVTSASASNTDVNDIIYVFDLVPAVGKDGDTTLYTYNVVKNGAITTETFSVEMSSTIDAPGAYQITSRSAANYATAAKDAETPYAFTATLGTGDQAKSLSDSTLVYGASSSILVDSNTVVISVNKTTGALTEASLSEIQATTTSGQDYSMVKVVARVENNAATGTAAVIFIMGTGTVS